MTRVRDGMTESERTKGWTMRIVPSTVLLLLVLAAPAPAQTADAAALRQGLRPQRAWADCGMPEPAQMRRTPTAAEMRCRFDARGPGAFGLLSYLDVPVYRPATPLPGTHVVGVPGMPHPAPGEGYEAWEWRMLRTTFGADVRRVENGLAALDPVFMSMIRRFERALREGGVRARRRETYRTAARQAWVFQQGRVRPGPIATTTLTSWHNRLDRLGRPAARAADYDVAGGDLPRFHRIAEEIGLRSYGADSHDPGHVFLPDEDAADGLDVAALRTLPRVMHVTLATGRPEGEYQPPGAAARWRDRERAFAANPLPHYPTWHAPAVAPRDPHDP